MLHIASYHRRRDRDIRESPEPPESLLDSLRVLNWSCWVKRSFLVIDASRSHRTSIPGRIRFACPTPWWRCSSCCWFRTDRSWTGRSTNWRWAKSPRPLTWTPAAFCTCSEESVWTRRNESPVSWQRYHRSTVIPSVFSVGALSF